MQEYLSTNSHPSLRLIPRTLSLSAPSDSARWPSILFLSEKVFRRESEEDFGVIWNIIHCLPSECIMLVSTPLPRALMMSGLDSGKGDLMYLLTSHPCNPSSTSTQQLGMILNTKCGCDHVLPITESLTALQGLREMLQTLSAGSCPALSVPPVHPPPPPLPHGAFLILSTLHSLPRILPFFARPSLALPSPYPSTLPTWWTCSCPLKLVFISPPPSNLSPPLM